MNIPPPNSDFGGFAARRPAAALAPQRPPQGPQRPPQAPQRPPQAPQRPPLGRPRAQFKPQASLSYAGAPEAIPAALAPRGAGRAKAIRESLFFGHFLHFRGIKI
jgi:hypothetical protein